VTSAGDAECLGHSSVSRTGDNVDQLKELVLANRRITISEVADMLEVSFRSVKTTRSLLFWDVMQHRLVVSYESFGTSYWSLKMGKTQNCFWRWWQVGLQLQARNQANTPVGRAHHLHALGKTGLLKCEQLFFYHCTLWICSTRTSYKPTLLYWHNMVLVGKCVAQLTEIWNLGN
jgi:hypothetical protein